MCVSYHIISYHIISYHIISYHIISYHIILHYIISYRMYHIILCIYIYIYSVTSICRGLCGLICWYTCPWPVWLPSEVVTPKRSRTMRASHRDPYPQRGYPGRPLRCLSLMCPIGPYLWNLWLMETYGPLWMFMVDVSIVNGVTYNWGARIWIMLDISW